jgi:hypothetical protein
VPVGVRRERRRLAFALLGQRVAEVVQILLDGVALADLRYSSARSVSDPWSFSM